MFANACVHAMVLMRESKSAEILEIWYNAFIYLFFFSVNTYIVTLGNPRGQLSEFRDYHGFDSELLLAAELKLTEIW